MHFSLSTLPDSCSQNICHCIYRNTRSKSRLVNFLETALTFSALSVQQLYCTLGCGCDMGGAQWIRKAGQKCNKVGQRISGQKRDCPAKLRTVGTDASVY